MKEQHIFEDVLLQNALNFTKEMMNDSGKFR
ncbi:hypothetical protein O163_05015 [Caldanaerobacter subterraneus subsp. yonseiensis KB-1]|uniref:Uncharacterized protein n=1 Tax=Caldanaerobacter subterraneus subsp. yonseiensis KB-1 TaxID=1388761 RepID=U5CHW8_CALSX|nr:hypothetical protein O163_05015 [Caldanaerobacter subterraneus subsp. yonseiensis KB-1]